MILEAVVVPDLAGVRLDEGAKMLFPRFSKTRIRKVIGWGGCGIFPSVVRVAGCPLRGGRRDHAGAVTDRRIDFGIGIGRLSRPGKSPLDVYCMQTGVRPDKEA